ncbi:MAG: hypothetical protein CSYNP_03127 [Syntrophus sp. SKADARSKE-3]|nr:hypothetical protein [Syntrophus sp. SKADARSKE-3]
MFKFDKQFFEKHQQILLYIANRWYLRWLLGLNRLPKELKNIKIDKITPNSIHSEQLKTLDKFPEYKQYRFDKEMSYIEKKVKSIKGNDKHRILKLIQLKREFEGVKEYFQGKYFNGYFFCTPRFAEALAYNLSPLCYFQDLKIGRMVWRFSPVGLVYLLFFGLFGKLAGLPLAFIGTTETFYPGANSNNSIYVGGGTDWTAKRNATTGTRRVYSGNVMDVISYYVSSYVYIDRVYMNFDTSGLPDGATVTDGSVNVYCSDVTKTDSPDYRLYNSTASDPLADDDFDQCGSTELSDTHITAPTKTAYNSYSLNTAGKSAVSLTGLTKVCIREYTYDVGNVRPGGSNIMELQNTNPTGTTTDPYLSVTYSTIVMSFIPQIIMI